MKKNVKKEIKELLGSVVISVVIAVMAIGGGAFAYKTISTLTPSTQKLQTNYYYIEEDKPSYDYLKSVTVKLSGCFSKCVESYDGSVDCGKSSCWTGTGIVIKIDKKYTYILTNAHVAGKNKENISLFVNNGNKELPIEIVKYHNNLDLAVVKLKGTLKNKRAIKGISVAKPQDAVYLVGHHLGRSYIYGEGVFAGYDGISDIIQIPCAFGNSGSGVFDKNGKLIAVVYAINRVGMFNLDLSHAICVDGLSVELFLEQLQLI